MTEPTALTDTLLTETDARRHYFELVQRNAEPREKDRALLQRVLIALGIKADQFRRDADAFAQASSLIGEIERQAHHAHQMYAPAEARAGELDTQIAAMREQLALLEREREGVFTAWREATDERHAVERKLQALKTAHRELFSNIKLRTPNVPAGKRIEIPPSRIDYSRCSIPRFNPNTDAEQANQFPLESQHITVGEPQNLIRDQGDVDWPLT